MNIKIVLTVIATILLCSLNFSATAQAESTYIKVEKAGKRSKKRPEKSFKDRDLIKDGEVVEKYDDKGKVISRIKRIDGKLVEVYAAEPTRDLGPFAFMLKITFWIQVFIGGFVLWFIFAKILFKSRPF